MPIHASDKETEKFFRIIKLVNTFSQVHACVGVIVLIVIIWINNEHALQGGIKNTSSSVHAHKSYIQWKQSIHSRHWPNVAFIHKRSLCTGS